MDSGSERERRKLIRDTYLSFYKNDDKHRHRICSLNDLLQGIVAFEDCQVAYAFFVGANPSGPSELLFPNDSFPILATRNGTLVSQDEDDIVYLNIRENMEDGKSPTWLKYASMVVVEKDIPFDYIAKFDSDTLVFMPAFLEFASVHMSDSSGLKLAGLPFLDYFCELAAPNHDHSCPLPLTGGLFMSGEGYMMSPGLARLLTSKECIRSPFIRHEDVLVSNWAFHCAANLSDSTVRVIPVRQEQVLKTKDLVSTWYRQPKLPHHFHQTIWGHANSDNGGYFKDLKQYRDAWQEFVKYWNESHSDITMVSSTVARW